MSPDLETLTRAKQELPPDLNREIAPGDDMYLKNDKVYFSVGRSALRAIYLAMLAAHKTGIGTILDLPCGYGRVMRWLKVAFPDAELTACDLTTSAVDFCASRFGAHPIYSTPMLDRLALPKQYDLIWCGSLLTHLDDTGWTRCLRLFQRALAPGGLLVFTTRGRWVAEKSRREFFETLHRVPPFFVNYDRSGFAFEPSLQSPAYGNSLSKPSWVCDRLSQLENLQIVWMQERGWAEQQDVFACVRTDNLPHVPQHEQSRMIRQDENQKLQVEALDKWAHDLETTVKAQQAQLEKYEQLLPVRVARRLGWVK
jgi:SAM-dependent methyltransferase